MKHIARAGKTPADCPLLWGPPSRGQYRKPRTGQHPMHAPADWYDGSSSIGWGNVPEDATDTRRRAGLEPDGVERWKSDRQEKSSETTQLLTPRLFLGGQPACRRGAGWNKLAGGARQRWGSKIAQIFLCWNPQTRIPRSGVRLGWSATVRVLFICSVNSPGAAARLLPLRSVLGDSAPAGSAAPATRPRAFARPPPAVGAILISDLLWCDGGARSVGRW